MRVFLHATWNAKYTSKAATPRWKRRRVEVVRDVARAEEHLPRRHVMRFGLCCRNLLHNVVIAVTLRDDTNRLNWVCFVDHFGSAVGLLADVVDSKDGVVDADETLADAIGAQREGLA